MSKDSRGFKNLLNLDLALGRFLLREWFGIKGFPSLDLVVREDFPKANKV